jgi:hypothetical protein
MRKEGSSLRYAGWGVLIVIIVGLAGVAIGWRLGLLGDQRTYIDVNSGDLAKDRTIFGYTYSHEVVPTDFGDNARKMGLAQPDREWREVVQFSWLSGTKTDFPMHGADTVTGLVKWRLRNEKTDADKKKLMAEFMDRMRAGDEKGMDELNKKVGAEQDTRAKAQAQHEDGDQ